VCEGVWSKKIELVGQKGLNHMIVIIHESTLYTRQDKGKNMFRTKNCL